MSRHFEQTSSNLDTYSEKLQLAVPTQLNKRLMHEILPCKITKYQNQDEIYLLLITTKQFNFHYFTVEQQLLLSLPEKASQVSQTVFR